MERIRYGEEIENRQENQKENNKVTNSDTQVLLQGTEGVATLINDSLSKTFSALGNTTSISTIDDENFPSIFITLFNDSQTSEQHYDVKISWKDPDSYYCYMHSTFEDVINEIFHTHFNSTNYVKYFKWSGFKNKEGSLVLDFEKDLLLARFFSGFVEHDAIVNCYVNAVIKKFNLPDRNMLIQLSALRYETRSSKTRMYFIFQTSYLNSGHRNEKHTEGGQDNYKCNDDKQDIHIENAKSTLILNGENLRTVKKFMELSGNGGKGLVIRTEENGESFIDSITYRPRSGEVYVEFTNYLNWRIGIEDDVDYPLLLYQEGRFIIPGLDITDASERQMKHLQEYIKNFFATDRDRGEYVYQRISRVIQTLNAVAQHGSSVVFLSGDVLKQEVERLIRFNRGFLVSPFSLADENEDGTGTDAGICAEKVRGISSIDGATISDESGYCRAVGVILDGESVIAADTGRGARFNSLRNYGCSIIKKYREKEAFVVVVIKSEDGMLDILCGDEMKWEQDLEK